MTKQEQVKIALECCTSRENKCSKCPYQRPFGCRKIEMIQDALRLINEQEAEIERLKILLEQSNAGIVNCSGCGLIEKQAVKEFAEKLKQKYAQSCSEYYPELIMLTSEQLDELLKEYEK